MDAPIPVGVSSDEWKREDEQRLELLEQEDLSPQLQTELSDLRQRRDRFISHSLERLAATAAAANAAGVGGRRVFHALTDSAAAASSSSAAAAASLSSSLCWWFPSSCFSAPVFLWTVFSAASLVVLVVASLPQDSLGEDGEPASAASASKAESPLCLLLRNSGLFLGLCGLGALALQIHAGATPSRFRRVPAAADPSTVTNAISAPVNLTLRIAELASTILSVMLFVTWALIHLVASKNSAMEKFAPASLVSGIRREAQPHFSLGAMGASALAVFVSARRLLSVSTTISMDAMTGGQKDTSSFVAV